MQVLNEEKEEVTKREHVGVGKGEGEGVSGVRGGDGIFARRVTGV